MLPCGDTGKTKVSEDFSPFRRDGRAADCTGLENRETVSLTFSPDNPSDNPPKNSAFHLALLVEKCPDLALVVQRWNTLPQAIQAGILAMVKASPSNINPG